MLTSVPIQLSWLPWKAQFANYVVFHHKEEQYERYRGIYDFSWGILCPWRILWIEYEEKSHLSTFAALCQPPYSPYGTLSLYFPCNKEENKIGFVYEKHLNTSLLNDPRKFILDVMINKKVFRFFKILSYNQLLKRDQCPGKPSNKFKL